MTRPGPNLPVAIAAALLALLAVLMVAAKALLRSR
jgi:hypothetical protein